MRTEILIESDGIAGSVDMYDDVDMSFNYNIVDIAEPEKGVGDYSKTIILPGTKNNHQLASHIFEITTDYIWNTNKKVGVGVYVDSILIMRGYLRLLRIIQKGKNDIDFEVSVVSDITNLFRDIGSDELTILNLARLNHTYNETNIINSWTAPVGEGYVYPFIDYNMPQNNKFLLVHHFLPAIYVKELIDRIFEYYGYKYTSAFFSTTFFKRLIIPFSSDAFKLDEATVALKNCRVSRGTSDVSLGQLNDQSINFPTISLTNHLIDLNDITTGDNNNPGGVYNLATDRFSPTSGGYYSFEVSILFNAYIPYPTFTLYSATNIFHYSSAGVLIQTYHGGITTTNESPPDTDYLLPAELSVQNIYMNVGDYMEIVLAEAIVHNSNPISFPPTALTIKVSNLQTYFKASVENNQIYKGDMVTINSAIPTKIKINDFLASLKKMFNLYFSIDKDDSRKYFIEPRDDWYNSTIMDWSGKIDYNKDIDIIPMGDLDSKKYIFEYRKDEDYLNKLYYNRFSENYGSRIKSIDNDFLKNEYHSELIFSPTPLYSNTVTNRIYPLIYDIDDNGIKKEIKSNLRILYYGGLRNCDVWYLETTQETQYPYAGHLDDPINPTIDLCFGVPFEVYYLANQLGASYTNNNLYNLYWRNFIDSIVDINSKIVKLYLNLKSSDILTVNGKNIFFLLDEYWRLNKIIDYNPIAETTTLCEFVKVRTSSRNFSEQKRMGGGNNNNFTNDVEARAPSGSGYEEKAPMFAFSRINPARDKSLVIGEENYVDESVERFFVSGYRNSVGKDASDITILNSSGCVIAGGMKRATIINSSGVTIIGDGITIINSSGGVYSEKELMEISNTPIRVGGVLSRISNINGKAAAGTTFDLYTCPSGKKCFIDRVIVWVQNVHTPSYSSGATVDLTVSSPGDIFASWGLAGLDNLNSFRVNSLNSVHRIINSDESMTLDIVTPANVNDPYLLYSIVVGTEINN